MKQNLALTVLYVPCSYREFGEVVVREADLLEVQHLPHVPRHTLPRGVQLLYKTLQLLYTKKREV